MGTTLLTALGLHQLPTPLRFCFTIWPRIARYSQGPVLLGLLQSVTVSQSFLVFHGLDSPEECWSGGQVVCRMPFNLSFSGVFSWLDWDYTLILGKNDKKVKMSFSGHVRAYMISTWHIPGGIDLDHLVEGGSARFLCEEKLLFPFHPLFDKTESLSPALTQQERHSPPAPSGRRMKEFLDIY